MCVHPKTKSKLRSKLKELTNRSWNIGYAGRKEVLTHAIRGWVSYFRFPTSHTTVHAVPHTAVLNTDATLSNNP